MFEHRQNNILSTTDYQPLQSVKFILDKGSMSVQKADEKQCPYIVMDIIILLQVLFVQKTKNNLKCILKDYESHCAHSEQEHRFIL